MSVVLKLLPYLRSKYCFSSLLDAFNKFHCFLHFLFAQKQAVFVWRKASLDRIRETAGQDLLKGDEKF